MAEQNNAKCSICGKEYYMCVSCKSFGSLNPWKLHTDTSEHYKVYQVLHGYSTGVYNKAEAKRKLQTIDLSDVDSFKDNVKSVINEILSSDNCEGVKSDTASQNRTKARRNYKKSEANN